MLRVNQTILSHPLNEDIYRNAHHCASKGLPLFLANTLAAYLKYERKKGKAIPLQAWTSP